MLAIFKQHLDNLLHIGSELVKCPTLTVSAGKAGHIANIQAGVRTFFNDIVVSSHRNLVPKLTLESRWFNPLDCNRGSNLRVRFIAHQIQVQATAFADKEIAIHCDNADDCHRGVMLGTDRKECLLYDWGYF